MRKQLSTAINHVPPAVRYRMRNAIATARWVAIEAGHKLFTRRESYNAAFWDAYGTGDWMGLAQTLLRYCPVQSIVDVGCGDGRLLEALGASRPLHLSGLDGSRAALTRAEARGLPVSYSNLAVWNRPAVANLSRRIAGFDLAVSLETAEHLPFWCAGGFVRALAEAPAVIFSAAHPNQLGTLHMNEQPFSY
jgi:2-polyprenyl-3-methyl-5-hydroxy-6-metoxy-1,4-benzoquinol methylase